MPEELHCLHLPEGAAKPGPGLNADPEISPEPVGVDGTGQSHCAKATWCNKRTWLQPDCPESV